MASLPLRPAASESRDRVVSRYVPAATLQVRTSRPGVYLSPLAEESEDTVITGGTRSLGRRLLALNLTGSLRRKDAQSVEIGEQGDAGEAVARIDAKIA